MYDALIIGAGAVGLATAYQLKRKKPDWSILVVDKEDHVAAHQTGNNSGVIHSGVYYEPGGSRALLCRSGYRQLIDFADQYQVPYRLTGKYIVAVAPAEVQALRKIQERGRKNGLQNLQWLPQEVFRERAPQLGGVAALWVPQAGIISYRQLTEEYARQFQKLGGQLQLNCKITAIERQEDVFLISTSAGPHRCRNLINCAGLYSDKLSRLSGQEPAVKILPFRGEYYELGPRVARQVDALVYPVPNPNFPFLGVHLTPTIDGRVEAGPNAVLAYAREGYNNRQVHWGELRETLAYRGFRVLARKYWRDGARELRRSYSKKAFLRALQPLLPALTKADLLPGGAGVRAMAVEADGTMVDDFLFYRAAGLVNVANAPSPAATASLAIGERVAGELLREVRHGMS
ncbi:MAG: L-2-hydroxyglutarate oxidase [Bacteroidota bacterium]